MFILTAKKFIQQNYQWILPTLGILATGFFPHAPNTFLAILPWIVAGIGAIGQIGASIIGNSKAGEERERAAAAMQAAMDEIRATGVPPNQALPLVLAKFEQAGILNPEMEQNITQQFSRMAGVQTDPQLRQAQMQALNFLQQRGQVGFGPEERAAFNQVQREVARAEEAKRQQILQGMRSRGMGGSGAELATQLGAGQAAAEQAAMQGDRLAAAAAANALAAMTQSGTLSAQVRGQDFDEASARARAEDEMSRFNIQSQQNIQQRNIAARNLAQQYNLTNAQQIAAANTAQANQELLRQQQAERQYWLDKMEKAKTIANVYGNQQQQANQNAADIGQSWQNIGAGIGKLGGTIATALQPGQATTNNMSSQPLSKSIGEYQIPKLNSSPLLFDATDPKKNRYGLPGL